MPAIAHAMERGELSQHLRVGLGAGHAAVKLDDVAELAVERATARELNADVEIVAEVEEVETGDGALGDVDLELLALEAAAIGTRAPGLNELVEDALRFAEHPEISRLIKFRAR